MGLLPRVMLTVSLVMCLSFVAIFFVFLHDQADEAQRRLDMEIDSMVDVISPLMVEQIVIGDFATINQLLKSQIERNQSFKSIIWHSDSGTKLSAQSSRSASGVPWWFSNLFTLHNLTKNVAIQLGGVSYGELLIVSDKDYIIAKIWHRAIQIFLFGLGVTLLLLLAIGYLLRINLSKLGELAKATRQFEAGDYSVRINEAGSPELREATHAFNNMANQLEKLFVELEASRHEVNEQLHFIEELFASIPLPIFYKDREGIYLDVNRAWEEFFGVSRETIVGHTVYRLYEHDLDTARIHDEKDQELWAQPGVQVYERQIKTGEGKEYATLYSKATFTNTEGKVAGIIGLITDLTELKAAEARAQQALMEKVSAETANRAKSTFLANMSHEIRTPLTAIIGFAETLLDSHAEQQDRIEAIQTIIRSGKHLQSIISDILDLSKIEADRLDIETIPVELFEMLHDISVLAELQAAEKGIRFLLEPCFPLPQKILSDPTRIKQILMNLTNNAIKFTERGEVTLRVRYNPQTDKISFEVHDTGIGLSNEQQSKLFNPFTQADISTTRQYGGTGLGLYLSRQLAVQLGGDINVNSQQAKGSCFTLLLPVGQIAEQMFLQQQPAYPTPEPQVEIVNTDVRGTVLVAEDNPENQKLMRYYLSKLGAVQISLVENGEQAVRAALKSAYDLIFMDIQMPVMDGVEATQILRSRDYHGPIVALTANTMKTDIAVYKEIGCNDFVAKPIDQKKLYEVILRYMHPVAEGEDESAIISQLLVNDADMSDIVQLFIDGLDEKLQELREAIEGQNWQQVRFVAHNLKGTGGGVGYPMVTEVAIRLMIHAEQTDQQAANSTLQELVTLTKRIKSGFPAASSGVSANG